MGIPKFKGFTKTKPSEKNEKENHLKLVEQEKIDSRDKVLLQRKAKNERQKAEISAYQDAINKTLDDPEMAKKAAMILLEMVEGK